MKTFVCRCEDITLHDCETALDEGYDCFEDLKRYLGVATGPCQGKACVQITMQMLSERTGIPLDQIDVMTFRPPTRPVPFDVLAGEDA